MDKFSDIIPINKWFDKEISLPLIIGGPCSAETEQQVLETAHQLKEFGKVNIFRAGVWKPRTRPNNFEGIGKEALKWLKKVKEQTGLYTAIEVANSEHVKHAIDNGIDVLWIGARTVSNPFSVQEIADALKGIDIPVMIKNPINPDFELWIGAIERIHSAGIRKIAAVHRGFYPFEKTNLRNIPKWELPIELKRKFSNIPVICDPSHIAGNVELIFDIAQKALDLNMDGLMIESHCNPKDALSDAKQQVTPADLEYLLDNLKYRRTDSDNEDFFNILTQYRDQIDSIDSQMIELLAKRMKLVKEIGDYKSKNNVTILQLRRWEDILKTRTELGATLGLDKEFVKKMLQLIHKESIQKQTEVMQISTSKKKDN